MVKVCIIGSYAKALVMTTERIPLSGETLIGRDYRGTFGGKGSDMAVQSARLGANVSYLGVVGDDVYGKEFTELMQQEKINIDGLRITKEAATGVGFIIKDVNAQNMIVVAPGANDLFQKDDIDQAASLIISADVVLAQMEIPIETALYAMKVGRKAGKTTILNPAPARNLVEYDLSDVDILTPNETEAKIAAGLSPETTLSHEVVAELLLKTGCKMVIMTLGDQGAKIFTQEKQFKIEPYPIDVVDSNGAGDSFNAALATALADGKMLEEAVQYANVVAALCCTKWETIPSYHTAEEVDDFIKSWR